MKSSEEESVPLEKGLTVQIIEPPAHYPNQYVS